MDVVTTHSPAHLSAQSKALMRPGAAKSQPGLEASARKAATEFEAVFLTTMLEGMFSGLKTEPPFGGGHGEKIYRSMMVGEYAKEIARSGGLGIADHVYREIIAAQEATGQ